MKKAQTGDRKPKKLKSERQQQQQHNNNKEAGAFLDSPCGAVKIGRADFFFEKGKIWIFKLAFLNGFLKK